MPSKKIPPATFDIDMIERLPSDLAAVAEKLASLNLPAEQQAILSRSVKTVSELWAALFSNDTAVKAAAINNSLKELQSLSFLAHSLTPAEPAPSLSEE